MFMKIQMSTDYAIRILQYLHMNPGDIHTAMTIAQAVGVTYPLFIKIANRLKRGGLLAAVQGRNGGYQLGRLAEEISLYDVILCVEGEIQFNHCLGDENHQCDRGTLGECKLRSVLNDLRQQVIKGMGEQSIADVTTCA